MPPMRTTAEIVDNKCAIDTAHASKAMSYTFLNEMSSSPVHIKSADLVVRENSPPPTPQRTSHNKRRDASYIPRPPNAFILFRSSFIRDQKVSHKVEGNHSKLSKIIGMYWKALTKEQRDEWEDKAAQALIEHRKRYPDWRFRHAANTSANVEPKIKIKDGARRGRARKDPPDRGGGGTEDDLEEGSGNGRATTRAEEEASRLTKIAGLLSQGQEGEALERAVEEWEAERRLTRRSASVSTPDSAPSSPVMTRASSSADSDSKPLTLTLVLSPPSSVTSRSPVTTRACASSSMDPDLPRTASETPLPSPSLSVPSPAITSASLTEREPSLPYSTTPTPRYSCSSSPSTPRLSGLASTSASGSLPKPPPSWPASPTTPRAIASTASRPLPWVTFPATPRTPSYSSFPALNQTEHRKLEYGIARSKASPSPVLTRSSTLMVDEALSTFMTHSSSSELIPQPPTAASMISPSVSVSVSASSSRASTMEREPPTPSRLPCLDTSTPNVVPSRSSLRTPPTLPCTPSRSVPVPPHRWPNSPMSPHTASPWLTSPSIPRISTSFPAYTRAEEWEASPHSNRSNSIPKSALCSPVVTRVSALASASASALAAALEVPSSPSRVYALSTPIDVPSPSSAMSTSTPPVPIPRLASWPASPITSVSTPAAWPPSPLIPCSASFPTFTRAEDWELGTGHKSTPSNSASVLSSPIVIHAQCASPSTTDRGTTNRAPSVSSPLMTMARTTSWPASPALASALRSPIAARTPVPTPSWSNVPSSSSPAATSHLANPNSHPTPTSGSGSGCRSPVTATPILSRRSRPQSRSPTQRSPQNSNALCVGAKRSLSAPAPKRGHQRHWRQQQQEAVRMDAGFWWPAPHEQGDCSPRNHEPGAESQQEHVRELAQMPMQLHAADPTRDGSFDGFASLSQETEHEFGVAGVEGGERVWSLSDFGYDSESASVSSSVPTSVQTAPAQPPTPFRHSDFHLESTSAHELWFDPWDADTTVHAGESLHPLPPTPISPLSPIDPSPLSPPPFAFSPAAYTQCSSFSSLAGWDGSSSEPANATSDANHSASAGTCAAVKQNLPGIDGVGWGRSGLQRLGVQGGGYAADSQWVG